VRTRLNEGAFLTHARQALDDFDAAAQVTAFDPAVTVLSNVDHHTAIEELETLAEQVQPPLIRLEHALHGPVSYGIMPLFALANAGVSVGTGAMGEALASPVALGVILGLLVGKPLGITSFSWLAVRAGIAALPDGVTWRLLGGAGILSGIGFTMALFIASLAFADATLLDAAKLGVLAASTVAGIAGWLLLGRPRLPPGAEPPDDQRAPSMERPTEHDATVPEHP
jgi:NhaA family Na+:H+ antiporter